MILDDRKLYQTSFALHTFDLNECLHTSVDYTVMLGMPILPVPTLIEFLN